MFVMTAKLSKRKLIAAGVLLAALIVLIIFFSVSGGNEKSSAPAGASNDDRVAYLASFGWSVNAEPAEAQKVAIPDSGDNPVFSRYNDLQKSQGFDLTSFAGKDVMRYVYQVLNYPEAKEPVYATVLVSDGKIIGGDITNSAPDGVIHGFQKPGTPLHAEETQPDSKEKASETEEPAETIQPS